MPPRVLVTTVSEPSFPLIPESRLDHPLAICGGETISADRFLREAGALAERLPERRHVVNLCGNRYRFLLTLVAAVMRGQVSLLPPNRTPEALRTLLAAYPDSYVACDEPPPACDASLVHIGRPVTLSADVPNVVPDRRQVVAVVFTSGSTGEAEPHVKTWGIFRHSVDLIAEHFGLGAESAHATVATVPAQHMYGLETTILLPLRSRCLLTDQPAFYPADIQAALAAVRRPRMLVTTPIHLRACLDSGVHLPPVELIVSATAPLSAGLARTAERSFGGRLREIYGFTEAGSVAMRRTSREATWTLFAGLRLETSGETARLSAPYLAAPVPLQDRVALDDERHFRWLGRLSDHINIAGKRTSLTALNAALLSIPGVADGTFFVPSGDEADAAGVARLLAFVVAPLRTREAVLAELRQRIDPAFLPRPLFLVDALPRQEHGKLPRAALEALACACRR